MKPLLNTFCVLAVLCAAMSCGCNKNQDLRSQLGVSQVDKPDITSPDILATVPTDGNCINNPNDHFCGSARLVAAQHHEVGVIEVYCKEGTTDYFVKYYFTSDGCHITELHLYAGPEENIPKTKMGCPKVGHFPYKVEDSKITEICIDIGPQEETFVVAAHAVVVCDGDPFAGEETAWSRGKTFPGCNNWSMCFDIDCKK